MISGRNWLAGHARYPIRYHTAPREHARQSKVMELVRNGNGGEQRRAKALLNNETYISSLTIVKYSYKSYTYPRYA